MTISSAVRSAACSAGIFIILTHTATAQESTTAPNRWELRITSGALVPAGNQRKSVAEAQTTGAQLSWVVRPSVALTATFSWARSRDLGTVDNPKLDVFTTDVGVEARTASWFRNAPVTVSPFVGLGAGDRSYNYRKLDVDATHNLAGYATAGAELGVGRVGLRLEVRDYATGFKPLSGSGIPERRNDLLIMGALRFNRQHPSQN